MIVTNFAYGTGPYLRTTDLAIAFNDELQRNKKPRMRILVPWVYGEKQRRVMLEEFRDYDLGYPGEILLDAELGSMLRRVFYGGGAYRDALEKWTKQYQTVSQEIHRHLSGRFEAQTLTGGTVEVNGQDIAVELSRSPRVRYDVAPSYFSSFAYVGEILERASSIALHRVGRDVLRKGVKAANWVEEHQTMRFIAYPATFGYFKTWEPRYPGDSLAPPLVPPTRSNTENIKPGVFVTVTGIPGLKRLYAEATRLGIALYSNEPEQVPGSERQSPHIIPNKDILLQFARAGWSSIWISMLAGTPLVIPPFDLDDDPEIYFNNVSVKELELGIIYSGQTLESLITEGPRLKESYDNIKRRILEKFDTLDGNRYCAKLFVKDFLKK